MILGVKKVSKKGQKMRKKGYVIYILKQLHF